MAIALVSNTFVQSVSGGSVTTGNIDTTGASLLVIGLSFYKGVTATAVITDSKSNTWTPLTYYNTVDYAVQMFYAENPTVGTGHNFSNTPSGPQYSALFVAAFSGTATSSVFDQENGTMYSGFNATVQPGSVTPSANNELVVTTLCTRDGTFTAGSYTINSGFTITDQAQQINGHALGGGLAYLVQTTAAAVNPTWTLPGSGELQTGTCIATFKDPGGGPSGNPWYVYAQQ